MQGEQELNRARAALEDVLGAKAAAQQELRSAQQGAASAASRAAAVQDALEQAKSGLCKVSTYALQLAGSSTCALIMRNQRVH